MSKERRGGDEVRRGRAWGGEEGGRAGGGEEGGRAGGGEGGQEEEKGRGEEGCDRQWT